MSYEITDFQKDIIDVSMQRPVVVDFWAPWCGPCKSLGPILEKMAAEADDRWNLVKVNVDENQEMAASFQVQSIPQVYLVHNGKVMDGFSGTLTEPEVRKWLEPHLPATVEEAGDLDAVNQLIAAGQEERALTALGQLHVEDPENEDVKMLWVKLKLFAAPAEAAKMLHTFDVGSKMRDRAEKLLMLTDALSEDHEGVPAHPHVQTYYIAALEALAKQAFEETLDQFLEVLYRDKTYNEGGARKGIIGVFEWLGRDHALTKGYQRRFEMAMF